MVGRTREVQQEIRLQLMHDGRVKVQGFHLHAAAPMERDEIQATKSGSIRILLADRPAQQISDDMEGVFREFTFRKGDVQTSG